MRFSQRFSCHYVLRAHRSAPLPLLVAIFMLVLWLTGLYVVSFSHAKEAIDIYTEWGGHIRAIGTLSYPDDQSIYQLADTDTYYDRQGELRLNHQLHLGSQWIFEAQYELVGFSGDTLKNNNRLLALLPESTANRLMGSQGIYDDRRLMNLTRTIDEGSDYLIYHRLDRLHLTYTAPQATLRAGRQALTWGNGMVFNPMDLFNPFAPTTIARDYKVGDDMLHLQIPNDRGELQILYLPRRAPESGDIEYDQSSLAAKWHFTLDNVELDAMSAHHYGDLILSAGATGNLGGAAWRSDIIYTLLDDDAQRNDYWQFVVNMDYAWNWRGRTIYGLIEFFHNGLGENDDYPRALTDPALSRRTARGELFTLGRNYLAGQLSIELHPLLQTGLTVIINTDDPSTILQPQLTWDMANNLQLILGATINWGDDPSEFGGFDASVAGNTVKVAPVQSRYLWLTYYF